MTRNEFEALGNKMKEYEKMYSTRLLPSLPIMVRLDGRSFHTFTKGMNRPFDAGMSAAMKAAAVAVLEETKGYISYTQSDEITAIIPDTYFNGKKEKTISVLAATASVAFVLELQKHYPEKVQKLPQFDCRLWQFADRSLYAQNLLWRETDATRNSLSMACSAHFSQRTLHGVNSAGQHNLLHTIGINWNDYPAHFKRGSYFARRNVEVVLTDADVARIPFEHVPLDRKVIRTKTVELDMPPIKQVINIDEVIFDSANPVVAA